LSPASFAAGQPHDQYRWLRDNAPVRWCDEPGGRGFWAVTRHADVWAVDRDFQAFSSEPTILIPDPPPGEGQGFGPYKMMLMMDPPEHTAFRKLIRQEFTLPAARLREARIQALARQIVDAVIERGECDFVAEVAGEMPSFVIAELMGLPPADGRELYKLTEIIHTAPEALPPGAGGVAVAKMFEYGSGVIAEKRARPGDDLASRLLACEVDGRKLEDMEFLLFFLLLVDAGGDTTRNLLSGGLLALMEHPGQFAWLIADLRAAGLGAGGAAALDQPGDLHAPHRAPRRGAGRATDRRGRQGGHVLRRRQPRPGGLRGAGEPRPRPRPQPAHRLRDRAARVPGPAHRPHRDRRHAGRGPDPDDRFRAGGAAGMAALQLHFGAQGHAAQVSRGLRVR
jgi:cytochrome P450